MIKTLKNKDTFDYVILGGGCAGLSLAYHLLFYGKLEKKTLCIIERRETYKRDKTWSFWNFGNNIFDDCIIQSWDSFKLSTSKSSTTVKCADFPYVSIDSGLFYKKVLKLINSSNNILFYKSINDVDLSHGIVFNSLPLPKANNQKGFYQHFYGIEIETDKEFFNNNQLHLMDFSDTYEGVHFFYTLPFKKNKALIETTWISKITNHSEKDYLNQLVIYIRDKLNIANYNISFSEKGCLPLYHQNIKTKKNEILIGAAANLIRKSTGYAFLNIQNHSKFIINNIDNILSVSDFKLKSKYNFYDEILFRVIEQDPLQMPEIFRSLFLNNTNSVIKFLSGNSTLMDDFLAVMNLPKRQFMSALIK